MVGEQPRLFRATQANPAAGVVRRVPTVAATGGIAQAASNHGIRVSRVRFSSDGTAALELRVAAAGAGAATNDMLGPYRLAAAGTLVAEFAYNDGMADTRIDLPDLFYAVTTPGANWLVEVETFLL